jgi:hypothetical protein
MKAFLVAYDFKELHKKSELKIVKSGYVRGCPKYPATQIWSLEILRVKISAKVQACCQPLPMQQNLPISAQNFQNLPKSIKRRNFEIPPKIEILVFFKNKNFYV